MYKLNILLVCFVLIFLTNCGDKTGNTTETNNNKATTSENESSEEEAENKQAIVILEDFEGKVREIFKEDISTKFKIKKPQEAKLIDEEIGVIYEQMLDDAGNAVRINITTSDSDMKKTFEDFAHNAGNIKRAKTEEKEDREDSFWVVVNKGYDDYAIHRKLKNTPLTVTVYVPKSHLEIGKEIALSLQAIE